MQMIGSARWFAVLLLLGAGAACAQSTLPATGSTALPAASPQPSAAPAAAADSAKRAVVTYSGGLLTITADNSSLNQILREIGRVTGMKITGGVTDERVFGKYGPGAPAEILVRLLDGTGSNVLLRETASQVPAELILTARQGGPTPPNPNARGFDDDAPTPTSEPQAPIPIPVTPVAPAADPASGAASAGTYPPPYKPAGPSPPAGTSPNGVLTPQQIFEQLQQLQRTQPQTPANQP